MFLHLLDATEGVLVSRNTPGTDETRLVDLIEQAVCALDRAPVRAGLPKIHLCVIDAHTASVDAAGRSRLAEVVREFRSPQTKFAMVTSSGLARAAFAVMKFLIPRSPKQHNEVFATTDLAIAWLESERRGARLLLSRLSEQLYTQTERVTFNGDAPLRAHGS